MSSPSELSLDQAPPISVPFRFFLTAPLFALIAAAMLLWQGPDLFSSRWNPALLGTTHLLTLGYMGLIMLGAILQMLPVVAGIPVQRPMLVAAVVHLSVTGGILLLCSGLVFSLPLALEISMVALGAALLLFVILVIFTLRLAMPQNMTVQAIRMAMLMLAATVVLGLILLSNYVFGWWLQDREMMANLHLTWGLLGWVGLLVVGVAYQVVPMFQLTPHYPTKITSWLAVLLFACLLGLATTNHSPTIHWLFKAILAMGFASFAITTLWLQSKRRRKLPDVTLNFWRVGMGSLLLSIALWLMAQIVPSIMNMLDYELLLGILMVVGFAMSVINGMLYKIVPFLVWFHLQSRRGGKGPKVPNVREILAESRARLQMWLHFSALCLLLASRIFTTTLIYPAAILFGASNIMLWLNIMSATRTYYRENKFRQATEIAMTPI